MGRHRLFADQRLGRHVEFIRIITSKALSVCEAGAIFASDELPEDKVQFAESNAAYYRK